MHTKKKVLSIVLVFLLLAGTVFGAKFIPKEEVIQDSAFSAKDTLYFWYADASLTDHLTNAAAAYYEENGVHVIPVLKTGLEYLEEINAASLHPTEESQPAPDLYMITNDSLEKAYLSGLAVPVRENNAVCNTKMVPQAALDAVTYKGKQVAYPLYYETSVFLYNKTYLENAEKALPRTIDELLVFADEYDAPEQVEAVFKWDVSDIFYNYYFTGNYMNVGGPTGDDLQQIDIANEKTKACLDIYQNLNQFFSIEPKEVTYEKVLQDFIDGKIVMTVVTSDAIAKMAKAKSEGIFAYEYGMEKMPDLTSGLKGKSLSVTNGIAINGYSEKAQAANDFAEYLVTRHSAKMYENTGKLSACYENAKEDAFMKAFMDEYENSAPMPKLLGAGNFWVQLEICFSKIWTGADVAEQLAELDAKMEQQILASQ